jgi:hypothetical protein
MRADFNFTLNLIEQHVEIDEDYKHCKRGLEYLTREGAERRIQNTLKARTAVFEEHELQDDEGVVDPESLAIVYSRSTHSSQAAASITGVSDEQAALSNPEAFSQDRATSEKKGNTIYSVSSIHRTPLPGGPQSFSNLAA